jgi:hypothetical protein
VLLLLLNLDDDLSGATARLEELQRLWHVFEREAMPHMRWRQLQREHVVHELTELLHFVCARPPPPPPGTPLYGSDSENSLQVERAVG